MSTEAFLDELHKIAVESQEQVLKREKLLRAAKSGLASAGALGIGYGIGNLAADTIIPETLTRYLPRPTRSQLSKGLLIAGGLGTLGSLAHGAMRRDVRKYTEGGENPELLAGAK
jgi:hypothetical protein